MPLAIFRAGLFPSSLTLSFGRLMPYFSFPRLDQDVRVQHESITRRDPQRAGPQVLAVRRARGNISRGHEGQIVLPVSAEAQV